MAKLKAGPFGLPIGRIGNTVFYILNGQGVARSIGEQTKPATSKQKANRTGLKLTMNVLKPLQKFIKIGFEHKAKGTVCNSFNLATSYNKNHALQGEYPNLSINYKAVKLSSGELPLAQDLHIVKSENGLKVSWNPDHQWVGDQYDDTVMVALYHPKNKNASLFLNAGKREEGACFLEIKDQDLLNEPIEAYLCFKSADGESISDSVYLGNINGSQEKIAQKEINKKYTKLKDHFEKVKANYERLDVLYQKTGIKSKSLKNAATEYQILKERLNDHPGRSF